MRLARQLPGDSQAEVVEQIRKEFKAQATAVDDYSMRAAMAEASRQMNILASYVGTSVTTVEPGMPTSTSPAGSASFVDSPSGTLTVSHAVAEEEETYEGRVVGKGWPWGQSGGQQGAKPPSKHFGQLYPHRLRH